MYHSQEVGFGVKTRTFITKGSYFLQYKGEEIYSEETVLDVLQKPHPHYVMDLGTHWLRGDSGKGNISMYINHSCKPNIKVYIWDVGGKNKAFFRAECDIEPESWLSYDYNAQYHKERDMLPKLKCFCSIDCPNYM
jgi:histone-lysine N-methyltransferase SETD2